MPRLTSANLQAEPADEYIHPADAAEHCNSLWSAALQLMVEDARSYLDGRADPAGELRDAFEDLKACGPMTRRLAELAFGDPLAVSTKFVETMDRQRGQRRRKIGIGRSY